MKRLAIISAVLSAVIMLVATVRPASAHPVPFSYLDLRLQTSSIDGVFVVHIFDAAHDLQVTPVDRLLDPALASEYARALIDLLAARLEVAADGRVLAMDWSGPEVLADRQSLR